MIKITILVAIMAIGAGYYLGYFTAEDSPNDVMKKIESIAKDKVEDLTDSAKNAVEESIEKVRDSVK